MSKISNRTLLCRKCKKKFDVQVYDSVNVTLDPDLREKYLTNQLYVFKCPHCGEIHYVPYPILYHDQEKNFMVQSGTLEDVYDFYHMDLTMNGLFKKDNNPLSKIVRTGATNPNLAKEKVVALENGLNHKLATIYKMIVWHQYNEYAKEHALSESDNAYLDYDDCGDLAVIVEFVDENNKQQCYSFKFDKKLYDKVEHDFKKDVEGTCDYLFNEYSALMVLGSDESKAKIMKTVKPEIALVEDYKHNVSFVKVPTYNKGKFSEGDFVITENEKHWTNKCRVKKIIVDESLYSLPVDIKDLETILWKVDDNPLTASEDSNGELDNIELLKAIKQFDKSENDSLPYELMRDSDVIIGFCFNMNGPVLRQNEDGSEEETNIADVSVGDVVKPGAMRQRVVKYTKDNHPLLAVYLDQKNVPQEDKGEGISKMVVNFDEAIRYAIQMPELFDGICINPNEERIIISTGYLVDCYLADRILTNDKRTVRVLDKLNDAERKYVSDECLNYIEKVYFDGKNPKQISEEENIDSAVIGHALSKGYSRLKNVIRANYK